MTMYDGGILKTIEATATKSSVQRWAGFDAAAARSVYGDLRALGTQSKAHYIVEFTPLSTATNLNDLPLIQLGKKLGGLLVVEADYPIIALDTDAKKIGAFNINHITGFQAPEITLTFLETGENTITQSLLMWGRQIVNDDGTFNLPGSYGMYVDITMFDREYGISGRVDASTSRFLVAPTMATNNLAANDPSPALLPVTFTQLRQF